jgi:hypothetical protein
MFRTILLTLAGLLLGIGLVVVILLATNRVIRWITAPKIFEIEYGVLYLTVVLGAGFGAVCGALVGLAGVISRILRDRPPTSRSPDGPV